MAIQARLPVSLYSERSIYRVAKICKEIIHCFFWLLDIFRYGNEYNGHHRGLGDGSTDD